MNADDETNITDIELLPDGRIYLFGTSLEVLEILDNLQGGSDESVSERLQTLRRSSDFGSPAIPSAITEKRDG